jgi:hypothetical protein
MMRIKEKATGKLVFVGEEESLASFDPHLHSIWHGDYDKHNVGTFARYMTIRVGKPRWALLGSPKKIGASSKKTEITRL